VITGFERWRYGGVRDGDQGFAGIHVGTGWPIPSSLVSACAQSGRHIHAAGAVLHGTSKLVAHRTILCPGVKRWA